MPEASLTPFAGLLRLPPGSPLSINGFAFQYIDPLTIDRLLKVGAVTHHHDGVAAMGDPVALPTLNVKGTGGSIPASTNIDVTYTIVDDEGGESLPAPPQTITTAGGVADPQGVPAAAINYTAGNLLAYTYAYGLTVTDGAGGETALSPVVTVTVEPGFTHAEVILTKLAEILAEVGGTEWRLWRMQEGGEWNLIGNGTGAEFKDDGTHTPDCTVSPPATSTTHGTSALEVIVPDPAQPRAEFLRLYATTDGSFGPSSYLAEYPISEVGKTIELTALAFQTGAPPAISRSISHAAKINPDTDLIAFPWKRPVGKASELPTEHNENGDVRESLDDHKLHSWDGESKSWVTITSEGGGGLEIENPAGEGMASEPKLQFTGAGVSAVTDDPTHNRTVVTIAAGTIISYKGAWVEGTTYHAGDIVTRSGSSYFGISESKGDDPTTDEGVHWGLLAAAGAKGEGGGEGGLTWRGAWANATTYAVNDVVSEGGSSYVSIVAGNIGHKPAGDEVHWAIVAAAGAGLTPRGAWAEATTYNVADLVEYGGSAYVSRTGANLNHNPETDPTHWTLYVERGGPGEKGEKGLPGSSGSPGMRWRGIWAGGTTYAEDDVVQREGSSYISVAVGNKGHDPATDGEVHWQLVSAKGMAGATGATGPGIRWRGIWKAGTAYAPDDATQRGGSSYITPVGSTGEDPLLPNMIVNGGAESASMAGISNVNGSTVTRSETEAHDGRWSFEVVTAATSNSGILFAGPAITSGEVCRAEAAIFGTAGDKYRIALLNGSTPEIVTEGELPDNGWNIVSCAGTATSVIDHLSIDNGTGGPILTWYVDSVGVYADNWELLASRGGSAFTATELAESGRVIEDTWSLPEGVTEGARPGFSVRLGTGDISQAIIGMRAVLTEGGEATVTFYKNGEAIPGLTAIVIKAGTTEFDLSAKSKAEEEGGAHPPTPVVTNDYITMAITSIAGEVVNLAMTLFREARSDGAPMGPEGRAGAPGAKGEKGERGEKGEKGEAGGGGEITALLDEPFSENLLKDYVFYEGAESGLEVSAGVLHTTDATYHAFRGTIGVKDFASIVKYVPKGNKAFISMGKLIDATHIAYVQIKAGKLAIVQDVAGELTTLHEEALVAETSGDAYWLVMRMKGNFIVAEVWSEDPRLGLDQFRIQSCSAELEGEGIGALGASKEGYPALGLAGFTVELTTTESTLDDWVVAPYALKGRAEF